MDDFSLHNGFTVRETVFSAVVNLNCLHTVSGWGEIVQDDPDWNSPGKVLRTVDVQVIENDSCHARLGGFNGREEHFDRTKLCTD